MLIGSTGHNSGTKPLFLTDGGLETTLIFHEGWDLPEFAAFPLLTSSSGRKTLRDYYRRYLSLAERYDTGFVLATPTWRASQNWGDKLGFSAQELDKLNQKAVSFMYKIAAEYSPTLQKNLVVSGQIGPYDDAYAPTQILSVSEAEEYHAPQVCSFAKAMVDQIDVLTLTHVEEAVALTHLAVDMDLPIVLGFTVETDGTLPSGESLADAIRNVDSATGKAPAHYMINCAHPDHFANVITNSREDTDWLRRIGGLRANASRQSHAELDNSSELDEGDPEEFATLHNEARNRLPNLWVIGGCCGTDHRHVEAIANTLQGR